MNHKLKIDNIVKECKKYKIPYLVKGDYAEK